jgi:hypothetical protein
MAASALPDFDAVFNVDDNWPNITGPTSVNRYESVGSNVILNSAMPIPSVCRHSPVPVSQILTVRSCEADASRRESCEKATDLTRWPWPSSVCRHSPVPASQILTVPSSEADASRRESCEKTTDAVLFNHVHGLWIRSESIDERSIEESFSTFLTNSPRSTYPWIKIDVLLDSDSPSKWD